MAFVVPLLLSSSPVLSTQWTSNSLIERRRAPFLPTRAKSYKARVPSMLTENGAPVTFSNDLNGSKHRIGVVSTRWNRDYVQSLEDDVTSMLKELKVEPDNIVKMQVPGSFELPMAARLMCSAQKVDAVVCLGVLIKGDSEHYENVAAAVTSGLMDLQLTLSIPMIFGLLTCSNKEQATDRSIGDKSQAANWARTAVEMANLRVSQVGGVSAGKKSVGFS